eukprot:m.190977 g.190977  ORF g.190977 m.190977 type:complete len:1120 (-) comp10589_c1_seq3:1602-4961(-)
MPAKVPYKVVSCTGSDDGHGAAELEIQTVYTKGWQSPRFCTWPQEIVLRLDRIMRVRKIQLLAHQYKISTKVEIFVGMAADVEQPCFSDCEFERLGHVSFSDNKASEYKSRELKSVHVDVIGQFVKFVLRKNHVNHLNLYNQVGMVAINIIADVIDTNRGASDLTGGMLNASSSAAAGMHRGSLSQGPGPRQRNATAPDLSGVDAIIREFLPRRQSESATLGLINQPARIGTMDDLGFDILLDPETRNLIADLVQQKKEAIEREDYKRAKKLKFQIEGLQQAGEELGQLEKLKANAVDDEDYDRAAMVKEQVDMLRKRAYVALGVREPSFMPPSSPRSIRPVITKKAPGSPSFTRTSQALPAIGEGQEGDQQASHKPSSPHRNPFLAPPDADPVPTIPPAQRSGSPPLPTHRNGPPPPQPQETRSGSPPLPTHRNGPPPPQPQETRSGSPPLPAHRNGPPRSGSPPLPTHQSKPATKFAVGDDDGGATDTAATSAGPPKPRARPPLKKKEAAGPASVATSPPKRVVPPVRTGPRDSEGVDELSAENREHARDAIAVFGEDATARVFSSTWKVKVEGLEDAQAALAQPAEISSHPSTTVCKATGIFLAEAAGHKIKQVSNKCIDILESFFAHYAVQEKLSSMELAAVIEPCLATVLSKSGEVNSMIRSAVQNVIALLLASKDLAESDVFLHIVLKPMPPKLQWREAQGRLNIAKQLLEKQGFGALDVAQYFRFVAPCFKHSKKEVRDAAVECAVEAYKLVGKAVNDHLQLSDAHDGPILKTIREAFDAVPKAAAPGKKPAVKPAAAKAKPAKAAGPPTRAKKAKSPEAVSPPASPPQPAAAAPSKRPVKPKGKPKPSSTRPIKAKIVEEVVHSNSEDDDNDDGDDEFVGDTVLSPPARAIPPKQAARLKGGGSQLSVITMMTKEKSMQERLDNSIDGNVLSEEQIREQIRQTCVFCGTYDETFDDAALDLHYWKECPMLRQCVYCRQVVEVSALNEHWQSECSAAGDMKNCPKCKMARHTAQFAAHVKACRALPVGKQRCPLCQMDLARGEESWKAHLAGGMCALSTPPGGEKQPAAATTTPTPSPSKQHIQSKIPSPTKSTTKGAIRRGGNFMKTYRKV